MGPAGGGTRLSQQQAMCPTTQVLSTRLPASGKDFVFFLAAPRLKEGWKAVNSPPSGPPRCQSFYEVQARSGAGLLLDRRTYIDATPCQLKLLATGTVARNRNEGGFLAAPVYTPSDWRR